jgi:hypothetical protein
MLRFDNDLGVPVREPGGATARPASQRCIAPLRCIVASLRRIATSARVV